MIQHVSVSSTCRILLPANGFSRLSRRPLPGKPAAAAAGRIVTPACRFRALSVRPISVERQEIAPLLLSVF
jgi:hypothetical protein